MLFAYVPVVGHEFSAMAHYWTFFASSEPLGTDKHVERQFELGFSHEIYLFLEWRRKRKLLQGNQK